MGRKWESAVSKWDWAIGPPSLEGTAECDRTGGRERVRGCVGAWGMPSIRAVRSAHEIGAAPLRSSGRSFASAKPSAMNDRMIDENPSYLERTTASRRCGGRCACGRRDD
jgi:hypothetical protein